VWWVVSEGDPSALWVGLAATLGASAASLMLQPGALPRPRLAGAVRFAGFFLVQSVLGGVDVSMRALKPSLPIDPVFVSYPLRVSNTVARVLFTNTLSLLPGTLSARLNGESLEVHALDRGAGPLPGIARVEERVADLFGMELEALAGGGE